MNDDKWGEILDKVISRFEVLDQGKEELGKPAGLREFIIFVGPLGKMMFERTTRPKVLGEKSFGGSKYGAATGVEKIYSDTEVVKIFKIYKETDGQWEPMDDENLISNL